MEDYDKIKKVLALGFMHFLDENRPEGKMCLSNGECADIEKALNDQDWSKLARYLGKYLIDGGSSEIPKDLEEAAGEYAEKHGFRVPYDGSDNFYDDVDVKASKEGFIAGAKWQENKDQETIKLAEDHAFLAGADWQKEQMLKEAVPFYEIIKAVPPGPERDKVKLIICKED